MLTLIAHADRTLKDDERPFRYGLLRDRLKMNAKMNASILFYECQTYKAKHKICVCKVDCNVISTLLFKIAAILFILDMFVFPLF